MYQDNDKTTAEDKDWQVTTYLGTEWCHMSIINRDIGVLELLESIGLAHYRDRGNKLIEILDININWRMHRLSDGQKRRVQLAMGLLKPWRVLLLDEVTVDLDVIARSRLLEFLRWETNTRKCSVIYATHIFDGLATWPDNVVHLKDGKIIDQLDYTKDVEFRNDSDKNSNGKVIFHSPEHVINPHTDKPSISISRVNSLHPLALAWLRNDTGIEDKEI